LSGQIGAHRMPDLMESEVVDLRELPDPGDCPAYGFGVSPFHREDIIIRAVLSCDHLGCHFIEHDRLDFLVLIRSALLALGFCDRVVDHTIVDVGFLELEYFRQAHPGIDSQDYDVIEDRLELRAWILLDKPTILIIVPLTQMSILFLINH